MHGASCSHAGGNQRGGGQGNSSSCPHTRWLLGDPVSLCYTRSVLLQLLAQPPAHLAPAVTKLPAACAGPCRAVCSTAPSVLLVLLDLLWRPVHHCALQEVRVEGAASPVLANCRQWVDAAQPGTHAAHVAGSTLQLSCTWCHL